MRTSKPSMACILTASERTKRPLVHAVCKASVALLIMPAKRRRGVISFCGCRQSDERTIRFSSIPDIRQQSVGGGDINDSALQTP